MKITKRQAKSILIKRDDERAHTFANTGGMLLGADHDIKSLHKSIDESFVCKLTGDVAQGMGHGLAVIPSKDCSQKEILFVETDMEKFKRLKKKNKK